MNIFIIAVHLFVCFDNVIYLWTRRNGESLIAGDSMSRSHSSTCSFGANCD